MEMKKTAVQTPETGAAPRPGVRRRKRCWQCRYFGPMTGTVGTCDYLLETGHARSLLCPPGEKCTVFERHLLRDKPRRLLRTEPEPSGELDGSLERDLRHFRTLPDDGDADS